MTLGGWKQRVRRLQIETYAIYLAYRDPRTPWHARLVAAFVVGYAFSPIDLIPDFIPVLGYLDDLVIIPAAVALAMKMIPPHVLAECRDTAEATMSADKPTNWKAAGVIVGLWIVMAAMATILVVGLVRGWWATG